MDADVPRSRSLIVGAAVGVFLVTAVLPLAYMVVTSLRDVHLDVLFLDARQRTLLYNSALLASATAVLATLIGVPLGFGLARVLTPTQAVLRIALAAPYSFRPTSLPSRGCMSAEALVQRPPCWDAICSPAGRIACPPRPWCSRWCTTR